MNLHRNHIRCAAILGRWTSSQAIILGRLLIRAGSKIRSGVVPGRLSGVFTGLCLYILSVYYKIWFVNACASYNRPVHTTNVNDTRRRQSSNFTNQDHCCFALMWVNGVKQPWLWHLFGQLFISLSFGKMIYTYLQYFFHFVDLLIFNFTLSHNNREPIYQPS